MFGVCPQWVTGPGLSKGTVSIGMGGNQTDLLRPTEPSFGGRALDLVRIELGDLTVNGTLKLRAFRADDAGNATASINLVDYRGAAPANGPVLAFTAHTTDQLIDVYLSPIDGPATGAGPIILQWSLEGSSAQGQYDAHFLYRVCGRPAE